MKQKSLFSVYNHTKLLFILACNILRKGVAAIFGPQSPSAARHIQAICDTMEIPHLETRQYKMNRGSCLVNLFPHPQALSEVK